MKARDGTKSKHMAQMKSNDDLVKEMLSRGVLKRNEDGSTDLVTDPEEQAQLKQE